MRGRFIPFLLFEQTRNFYVDTVRLIIQNSGIMDLRVSIQDEILERFIYEFFGYGDLTAPIWFIGMEEGGDTDAETLKSELDYWREMGFPAVRDIAPALIPNTSRWFESERPPIQKTWGKLIRATLRALGKPTSNEDIRKFQFERLGRVGGETCLLELLPLRAQDISSWRYNELSELPYLQSRKAYEDHVIGPRIYAIRKLVETHAPSAVVFYGAKYVKHWKKISGIESEWLQREYGKAHSGDKTQFYIINHPGYTANALLESLGSDLGFAIKRTEQVI